MTYDASKEMELYGDWGGSDPGFPGVSEDADLALIRPGLLAPPSQPGQLGRIDDYEVIRLIGRGGMGMVFLARDTNGGEEVAIKTLRPELLDNSRAVRRFLSEARHMQRLSHPNILEVLHVNDRPAGPYFVLPYIADGSLAGKLRTCQLLDRDKCLSLSIQIADALAYAHSRAITHRDLKPGNVLIDGQQAYLADFGLGRGFGNDAVADPRAGQCAGTPAYMSPAVAAGKAEDTRCDIYAFGALLYEMLTGQAPYQGETSDEVRRKVMVGPPPPIREVNQDADPELSRIAEIAMARELRDRYAAMSYVLVDLKRIDQGKLAGATPTRANSAPKRRAWIKPAVVILLCIALLAGFAWMYQSRRADDRLITRALTLDAHAEQVTVSPLPPAPGTVAIYVRDFDLYTADADGNLTRLTEGGVVLGPPSLAAGKLAYTGRADPGAVPGAGAAIYIVEVETGERIRLDLPVPMQAKEGAVTDLVLNADATRLIWCGCEPGDRYPNHGLYLVDLESGVVERLMRGPQNHFTRPDWGDSNQIHFALSEVGDAYTQRVHHYDVSERLYRGNSVPSFSADPAGGGPRGRVAFTESQSTPILHTMNLDGSGRDDIPNDQHGVSDLQWVDNWLYYRFEDDVWRIRIDGADREQVTHLGDVRWFDQDIPR